MSIKVKLTEREAEALSYERHLPPHIRAQRGDITSIDFGAPFRIAPEALYARAITERDALLADERRLARKIGAYHKLIEAMYELQELGEVDVS